MGNGKWGLFPLRGASPNLAPGGDWLAQGAEGGVTQTEQQVRDSDPFPSLEIYSINNDTHGVSISNRHLEVPRLVWQEAWDRGEQHEGAEICTPLALPPLCKGVPSAAGKAAAAPTATTQVAQLPGPDFSSRNAAAELRCQDLGSPPGTPRPRRHGSCC